MSDPADERTAYREALARAEAAALADEASQQTPVAPSELPEAVPVSASDQPLPVEPVQETDTSAQQQEAPVAPAGPTIEELIAERDRLAAQVEEQKSMIGRQSTEVGEVRGEIAALREQIAAQQAQQATPQAPSVVITQELIETNPAFATQAALDQQNEPLLRVAFEAWRDEDPVGAEVWRSNQMAAQREAALKAEMDALRAEIAQVKEPLAQQSAQSADQAAWVDAFREMEQSHPDFLQNAERLLTEYAPQFPAIAQLIADGDKNAKVQGLKLLYDTSRLGNPDAVRAELEDAAAAAAAEAAGAANGAAVVAGQTTAGQGSIVEKTYEQLEQERYVARQEGKASLSRGWTGR